MPNEIAKWQIHFQIQLSMAVYDPWNSKNENKTKLDVRSRRWLEANLHGSRFSPSL